MWIAFLLTFSIQCVSHLPSKGDVPTVRPQKLTTLDRIDPSGPECLFYGDKLFYLTDNNNVICVGLTDLKLRWKLAAGNISSAGIYINEQGILVFGTNDGQIVMVNPSDGHIAKRLQAGNGPVAILGSGKDVLVYRVDPTPGMTAYDYRTDTVSWKAKLNDGVRVASARLRPPSWICLFLDASNGSTGLVALDQESGMEKWRRAYPFCDMAPSLYLAVIKKDVVFSLSPLRGKEGPTNVVFGLDIETGRDSWRSPGDISSAPLLVVEDYLVLECLAPSPHLVALKWPSKKTVWSFVLPSSGRQPILSGSNLLISCDGYVLYQAAGGNDLSVLDSKTGGERLRVEATNVVAAGIYRNQCYFVSGNDHSLWRSGAVR